MARHAAATRPPQPQTRGLGADARTFVDDCLAEGHIDPAKLPFYATRQVAEDLEAFRLWLGAPKLNLYGAGYGSELVQTYAQAHPDHVRALFVDGPRDLSQAALDFRTDQTRSFGEALVGTLLDCSAQPSCTRTVVGGNELNAYDQLAAQLAKGPIEYRYTLRTGKTEQRQFSAADLATVAAANVDTETHRMLLQRAVAAASQGNFWYLSRLLSEALGQDPDSGAPIDGASPGDALQYAVECADDSLFSGSPGERAAAFLDYGKAHGLDAERLGSMFYDALPCAWWPAQPADDPRPAPLTETPYPLFVLGATLDPATPWANAERIYGNDRNNAHLIVKPGGPHVIYGRGEACPDDLLTAYLVDGRMPAERRSVCPGDVADTYVPIPEIRAARFGTTEAALRSADAEMVSSADYLAWDGSGQLQTGCPYGGWIRYRHVPGGTRVHLRGCAWSRGLPLSGSGLIANDGGMSLDVAASSDRGNVIHYDRGPRGKLRNLIGGLAMFGGR